jgi:L-iditol 2-dehydrogenase
LPLTTASRRRNPSMQALMFRAPWRMDVADIEGPRAGPGQAVIEVMSSGICGSDVHGYTGTSGRRVPPLVMGHEVAGIVRELGEGVDGVRLGDRVVLDSIVSCGHCAPCVHQMPSICINRRSLGVHLAGGYAQRVVVPATEVFPIPDDLDWDHAAMVEPLSVGMHAVNRTPIESTGSLAIFGMGAIGLLTLLAARVRGAGLIIAVDRNPRRLGLARELGADLTVDAGAEHPVTAIRAATDGLGVDAVIDAVGITATVPQAVALVRPGGQVTLVGNSEPRLELDLQDLVGREVTVRGAYGSNDEFPGAIGILSSRRIVVDPLIERRAVLAEGPQVFTKLADGSLDAVKVILHPQG